MRATFHSLLGCAWGRLVAVGCGIALVLQGCRPGGSGDSATWPRVTLTPKDRILILAPHPDDEVLGCGGIIQQALAMHVPVQIAFLTYGDNNQWSFLIYRKHPVLGKEAVQRMGLVRHDEAVTAATILGVPADHLTFLGYPDFGTLSMWKSHWGDRSPFQSMLTRVAAVPYANALRPGTPYKGEEVLRDLTTVLREVRPTKVFVSHPAAYNPDHSALYAFTSVALWEVESELRPDVYPYLIHFRRWPKSYGYHPTKSLIPPALLQRQVAWHVDHLMPEAVDRKYRALRAHRTQYAYSARYLLSFVRANELFGDFPVVPLRPSSSSTMLSSRSVEENGEVPEELNEQERAMFVGLADRAVHLDGDRLVLSIAFSRPLAQAVEASVYFFGYRADRPFAEMPKLHVKIGALGHEVADQDRTLPDGTIQITRRPTQFTIRVPLAVLGDPQRILTSARTYIGEVPLDWPHGECWSG